MRYFPNISLAKLQEMNPYPDWVAYVPHKEGWLVFFCLEAYKQYRQQEQFVVSYCSERWLEEME